MKYTILFITIIIFNCCNDNHQEKGKAIAEKQPSGIMPAKTPKHTENEFGNYVEYVKDEDTQYYNAYNKTLELWKIPYQEINVPTGFGYAHVIVTGKKNAEPLVLLHGMNASSSMWYPNINALSQDHRVYAIDFLLEPGKSKMDKEVNDLEDILKWYNQIFDYLKLEKFSLVAASRGGWVAINIALEQKSRIKDMVLLSPCQSFIWIPLTQEGILTDITYTIAPKRKHLQDVLSSMCANTANLQNAFVEQFFIASRQAKHKEFILQMKPFSDDELRALHMPVLLLIGDQDIINKKKSIEKAKELLPSVETAIIRNAGHFLSFDQPDIINEEVLSFLNKNRDAALTADNNLKKGGQKP